MVQSKPRPPVLVYTDIESISTDPVIPEPLSRGRYARRTPRAGSNEPIRFYDRGGPYYEYVTISLYIHISHGTSMTWTRFTNFAPIPVIYMNREYPTAEHCTFLRAAIARADACRRSVPSPQIPGAPT